MGVLVPPDLHYRFFAPICIDKQLKVLKGSYREALLHLGLDVFIEAWSWASEKMIGWKIICLGICAILAQKAEGCGGGCKSIIASFYMHLQTGFLFLF